MNDNGDHASNRPSFNIFSEKIFQDQMASDQSLVAIFCELLSTAYQHTCKSFYIPTSDDALLSLSRLKQDFGRMECIHEVGDICLSGSSCDVFFTAISYENWDFERDVEEQQEKIHHYRTRHSSMEKRCLHALVVSKVEWEARKKHPDEMIQYKRLRTFLRHDHSRDFPFVLLFWEDVVTLLGENPEYLSAFNNVSTFLAEIEKNGRL